MARKQVGAAAAHPQDLVSVADLAALLAPILPTAAPAQGGLWLNNGVLAIAPAPVQSGQPAGLGADLNDAMNTTVL